MLTIIDPSRYKYIDRSFLGVPFGLLLPDMGAPRPANWTLGYKPRAGEENYFGNREVDHRQVHGWCWPPVDQSNLPQMSYDPEKNELNYARRPSFWWLPLSRGGTVPVSGGVHLLNCGACHTTYASAVSANLQGDATFGDSRWDAVRYLSVRTEWDTHISHYGLTITYEMAHIDYLRTFCDILSADWPLLEMPSTLNVSDATLERRWTRTTDSSHRPRRVQVFYEAPRGTRSPTSYQNRDLADRLAEAYWPTVRQFPKGALFKRDYYGRSGSSVEALGPLPQAQLSPRRFFYYWRHLPSLIEACEPKWDKLSLFGRATESAVENARSFTGNGIAYAKELGEIRQTVSALRDLLRRKVSPKTLSNLWLSYRYGLRLTAMDTKEIASAIADVIHHQAQTYKGYAYVRGTTDGGSSRCILYYQEKPEVLYFRVIKTLMDWDVLPDFTNVWDLVPFSFVVDWFVSVESLANAVDVRTYTGACEIVSTLYTHKTIWRPNGIWAGLAGPIELSRFLRETPYEPYQPELVFTTSLPSWKNILDGLSLFIGR